MAQSSHINEIFKSRQHIVNFLKRQGFNVADYESFSIHEVNAMYQAKQMDMLFKKEDGSKKTYVKYHTGKSAQIEKSLRPVSIYEYIEDLFTLEEILKKEDDLIIIINDEPNDTIEKTLRHIWEQDKFFVNVISMKRLQYNILDHDLVPPHTVLNADEAKAIRIKYNIMNDKQMPDISRFSPVSQLIGIRPGDICKITRPSKTAIETEFYRICT
uniref:RNA polymerase subunit H/Rpb5 C-terminal domain-containing protein n=1 Tax=viral metagenome TaxID=1070528 RepID=A0A6C0IKA8_9ZZZZ